MQIHIFPEIHQKYEIQDHTTLTGARFIRPQRTIPTRAPPSPSTNHIYESTKCHIVLCTVSKTTAAVTVKLKFSAVHRSKTRPSYAYGPGQNVILMYGGV